MSSTFDVVADGARAQDAPPGSLLARARAAAERQTRDATLDIVVGGAFGDRLRVRYGTLPIDDLERYGELAETTSAMSLSLDTASRACRTLLWVEDGETTDLEVRLDGRLWQLLDWPLPPGMSVDDVTTREVLDKLFGHNALALGQHLSELVQWMTEPHATPPGEH